MTNVVSWLTSSTDLSKPLKSSTIVKSNSMHDFRTSLINEQVVNMTRTIYPSEKSVTKNDIISHHVVLV